VSDPVRIREAGSDVPEELRELFRASSKPAPLTPAVDAMLSTRVAAMAATSAAAPTSLLVKALPWLLGGTLAVGGVATFRAHRHEAAAPQRSPAAAPAPEVVEPAGPPPAVAPPAPAPSTRVGTPRPIAAKGPPADAPDGLVGEERLLNEAHQAVAADPHRALSLAQSHARRYPHGQLAAERQLIMIEALVKLGHHRRAEALGRALRETAPNSIYEDRLDEILRKR
jgi:hypothetical protein